MKNQLKKLLSFVLVFVMVLSLSPLSTSQISLVKAENATSTQALDLTAATGEAIPTVDETNVVYLKTDGAGDGTSADSPVGSLTDAFAALSANGTTGVVYIVDAYTISSATTPSTMSHVKITSAGDTQSSLTISVANLVMGSGITFENINIIGKTDFGTALYANGHHLAATEKVTSPSNQMLKVYGGGNGTDVAGDVNITLNSGRYRFICGAGNGATVKGNVYLAVGGDVNDHLLGETPTWGQYDINYYFLAGGAVGGNSPVWGDVNVTINGNAAFRMIYGGTYATSQCNQIRITANGGYAYCLTGGGRYGVTTFKTTEGYGTSEGAGAVNMTINGGNFEYVFGAATVWPNANSTTVTGDVNIDINGGSMNYVFGGGNMNSLTGDVTIDVTNGTIANGLYGGGFDDTATENRCFPYTPNNKTAKAPVTGEVSVNISGGTITGPVCGGGYTQGGTANIDGTVNVNVTGGAIEGIVSGGGHTTTGTANVIGDVTLELSEKTFTDKVHGGGQVDGAGTANVEGNVTVNVASGTYQQVFGGGYATAENGNANVIGNVTINVTQGTFNAIMHGGGQTSVAGATANVTGDVTVDIETGTFTGSLCGGGYAPTGTAKVIGDVYVDIADGSYKRVCGAGYSDKGATDIEKAEDGTGGNVTLKISKGSFGGQVHGSGYINGSGTGTATVAGNTDVTMENGTYTAAVFGGGVDDNNGITNVAGTAGLTIKDGTFSAKVFGGGFGKYGQSNVGSVKMLIEGGTFGASAIVHGGCFAFSWQGTAEVTNNVDLDITGGTFSANVYGGGMVNSAGEPTVGKVGSVDMSISNGTFNANVFGGGNQCEVAGDSILNITGGTFATNVYGGSYNGLNSGNVTTNISGGTVTGTVYGGTYTCEVKGNVNLNATGGTFGKIYGGTYQGTATGDVNMNLTNCESKRVFGGGSGGTIAGDINLTVGKGVNSTLLSECTEHTDGTNHYGWGHHDKTYLLIAGGQDAPSDTVVSGSINLTVNDDAAFNYIFAGSNSAVEYEAINATINGGYSHSLYGGSYYNGVKFNNDAGAINMLITGGTFYQVFGGNEYLGAGSNYDDVTGDVNLTILGGTIYRRVYGGSYNNITGNFITGYENATTSHVIGNIYLAIGEDANITLDGNNHSYGDSDDTTDLSIFAHSRQTSSGDPFSDENATIVFLDATANTKYSGKLGADSDYGALGSTTGADGTETQYKFLQLSYDSDKYTDGAYPSPKQDKFVFAGWYTDRECTKPVKGSTAEHTYYYGKFVDKNVLTVQFQKQDSTSGDTNKINLRFVTTVDTLEFSKVGFIVEVDGVQKHNVSSSTVYEEIVGYGETEAGTTDFIYYKPTDEGLFGVASKYFMAYEFWNVPLTEFDGEGMTVTPYWITYDGTTVLGEARTIISDGNGSVKAK